MNIVEKKVEELVPYERNPRVNEGAVNSVAESIKNFGFKVPIVIDSNNVIIAGHTRLKAAKQLGMDTVPCIVADDLNEEQIKAFRLADNKVGELAFWDEGLLELELFDIKNIDMSNFGFELPDDVDGVKEAEEKQNRFEKMELRAFEHYDYLVFVFDNTMDWLNVANEFGLKKVDAGYGKTKKVGIGRVLRGKELVKRIEHKIADTEQRESGASNDN